MPDTFDAIYRGSVYDTTDPESRGRVRLLVPQVLGDAPSAWAEPTLSTDAQQQNVGGLVWVLFEGGDLNRPTYISRMLVGTSDIGADVVTANFLNANGAFIEALNGVDFSSITMTAPNIQTSAIPDQGIHLDGDGLRAYGPAGGAPFLDVNPAKGLVIIAGQGTFQTLTVQGPGLDALGNPVSGGSLLGGVTEIQSGGKIHLSGGATAPTSAPNVGSTYATVKFNDDGLWSVRRGLAFDGTYYYTTRHTTGGTAFVERWTAAGVLDQSQVTPTTRPVASIAGCAVDVAAGFLYTLRQLSAGGWEVHQFTLSTMTTTGKVAIWTNDDGTRKPSIFCDPATGWLVIAQSRVTNDIIRVRQFAFNAVAGTLVQQGSFLDFTGLTWQSGIATMTYGMHDFVGNRYVMTSTDADGVFRVMNSTTGSEATAQRFPTGMAGKVGHIWDASAGVFRSLDDTGTLRTYTNMEKDTTIGDPSLTKWVSSTFYRSGVPWETDQSPRASITIEKRSMLNVTTQALPQSPGANDPNQVQIYLGAGSSDPGRTGMGLLPGPAVGATTKGFNNLSGLVSGTHPPAANNFPASVGSSIEASTNGFTVNDRSDGSVGTGSFRTSVAQAAVDVKFRVGSASINIATVNTRTTLTVNFSPAFPAGTTPQVMLTSQIAGVEQESPPTATGISNTGFTLNAYRTAGTGSMTVGYIAAIP